MGLLFSMLKNDNQTLGNTTNEKKEERTNPDGSIVTRLDELAQTKLREDTENSFLCTFVGQFKSPAREFSNSLSAGDRLLSVQGTLEFRRVDPAYEGNLSYYPDEPPVNGWTSSDTAKKMTRLEKASERQKTHSGKESAIPVARNRRVQRFPTHSRHPIRK